MEYRAEANTRRLLDLFEASNIKATFFVLGWVARRSPELIREIPRRGHEVASHGMSHQLVYNQTPEEFSAETYESKALLEDIIGAPVLGYRASTLLDHAPLACGRSISFTKQVSSTTRASFRFAMTRYGIPDAPHRIRGIATPKGATSSSFRCRPLRCSDSAAGIRRRLLPAAAVLVDALRGCASSTIELARPFIFYLHPWEVDPEQPRVRTS